MADLPIESHEPTARNDYFVGLDLGQASDYTAIAVLELIRFPNEEQEPTFNIRALERTRGKPYTEIVSRVEQIMGKIHGARLVIDQTGVGAAVLDMFKRARLKPIGVMIHGGDRVSREGNTWRIPKRNLVSVVQVPVQDKRMRVADVPLRDVLLRELLNFKCKIDPETAHDSYSAWRESEHDDLVLAVALACWYADKTRKLTNGIPSRVVTFRRNVS